MIAQAMSQLTGVSQFTEPRCKMSKIAFNSKDEKAETMIKLSGALMVLANIAITVAMLAAIAAHAHSPSVKDKDSADDARQSD